MTPALRRSPRGGTLADRSHGNRRTDSMKVEIEYCGM